MMSKKEVDITVYGATSFVAKHVIRYLVEAAAQKDHPPKSFVVALGGRSKTKLEALQKKFAAGNEAATKMFAPIVFVADGNDLEGLKKIAQKSKVVLNCAGPYSKYSSNVVAACAEHGADYVDFTGETNWVAEMRLKYSAMAKKSGARIVSLCGYDSIPSDLALFAAVQALRGKAPNAKIESGTIYHQAMGGANGGTIHTALDMPVDLKRDVFKTTTAGTKQTLRKVPFLMGDPLQLTHPQTVRHNPDFEATRNRYALSEWLNQLLNFHSEFSYGVSIPMFMSPINMKVLHASSIALKYGPNFKVRERFLPCGFVWTRVLGIMGFIPAICMQLVLFATIALLKMPYLGKAIADFLTPPGSGVPDSISALGTTAVYATVTSDVKDLSGKVDRGYAYLSFKGDAGNWTTAQCICESAFCLIFDKDSLPKRSEDGFGTPAEIFGDVLIKRFKETKVRPVDVQINVRTDVNKNEMKVYINDM
ncbi:unnamed protein product [Cylindrotheca closterium]|uniref:Saccharopine dehydrogenase NADP binding domain-containing protein n=1 Tax=Cylindrotheca closterium TaxID=2856 RepID=A0AAD2JLX4_9STRA|nr:unnamed protein product [Cylindrotheca closterium]